MAANDDTGRRGKDAEPRIMHVTPADYLAGFTPFGRRDEMLTVGDRHLGKTWRAKPDKVGRVRDFYRVDAHGIDDPTEPEVVLQQIEVAGMDAIRAIEANRSMVDGELRDNLLGFIAAMRFRVPARRREADEVFNAYMKPFLLDILKDPATFEGTDEVMPPEEFLALIEDGRVKTKLLRVAHVPLMFNLMLDQFAFYDRLGWDLWIANAGEPAFITSDDPVTTRAPGARLTDGARSSGPSITFPLTRRMAVVGSAEGRETTRLVYAESVGRVNGATAHRARVLYCPDDDAVIRTKSRRRGGIADFLADKLPAEQTEVPRDDDHEGRPDRAS